MQHRDRDMDRDRDMNRDMDMDTDREAAFILCRGHAFAQAGPE